MEHKQDQIIVKCKQKKRKDQDQTIIIIWEEEIQTIMEEEVMETMEITTMADDTI